MKIQTMREQVRDVAQCWREVYGSTKYGEEKRVVQSKLDALNVESATALDVAKIIGNGSWVQQKQCNECGIKTWDSVEIGEKPDYESQTATVCIKCLHKAVALIENQR
jgi:hypothetical protein